MKSNINFTFWKFLEHCAKFRALKMAKMAFLQLQESQNCIEGEEVALSLSLQVLHVFPKAQCSRNFQNVKLRLDFVKFDNFTATQILLEIKFWKIQTVHNVIFGNFRHSELWKLVRLLKYTKNQNSEHLKLAKVSFMDH